MMLQKLMSYHVNCDQNILDYDFATVKQPLECCKSHVAIF